ncbi:PH domain-containing protein [Thermococcus thioreducens]|uniref:Uncharacterized protein n=1 Tax=Thermococcus thioreducens TaxID=277988 RepID=A0A0Q2XM95_9EURY|nr:hypothetical protein [Thermococcus thioreducens]ASJ12884.1 hypothetical protein A3L14_08290 [Thermococcus thioreducens]KQH82348.1 hypothetical protein AMR53_07050 [Thermococcus thioreducens]SEV83872.1 hypothetical protein SAMN05216170_0287 [Thermococcus thioreducens]
MSYVSGVGLAALFFFTGDEGSIITFLSFVFLGFAVTLGLLFFIVGIVDLNATKKKIKEARKEKEELKKKANMPIDKFAKEYFSKELPMERCRKIIREYSQKNNADWRILSTIHPQLEQALVALSEGNFMKAGDKFREASDALNVMMEMYKPLTTDYRIQEILSFEKTEVPCVVKTFPDKIPIGIITLTFASNVCHVLHYGDMDEARNQLEKAKERLKIMREEKRDYTCGDLKFFQYLFEFHYFLLKAVVEVYEAEVGAVAKLREKQAERLAEAKPVEVPAHVEKIAVSTEEPEKELYRGEVRFTMGTLGQERVGTLVITNKRLKLTGKYRLRGMVATVAIKAALRAAGIGEVHEDIPLKDIKWLELKRTFLGSYYLEFKARDKKYTIYTDAAQHIYNLLRQYGAEAL